MTWLWRDIGCTSAGIKPRMRFHRLPRWWDYTMHANCEAWFIHHQIRANPGRQYRGDKRMSVDEPAQPESGLPRRGGLAGCSRPGDISCRGIGRFFPKRSRS